MTDKNLRPLILFSGGQDSSYLLQQYLQAGDVYTLYVEAAQHWDKVTKEKEARQKIIRTLELRTGNKVLRDYDVTVSRLLFGDMLDAAFKQPMMWLTGALQISDAKIHSELAIAYVSGDQIMPKMYAIDHAWHNMQLFSKASGVIPMKFPTDMMRKADIMRDLWPEVAQYTWVCEMPRKNTSGKIVPCGGTVRGCEACRTLKAQLYLWKLTHGQDYWRTKLAEYRNWEHMHPMQAAKIKDIIDREFNYTVSATEINCGDGELIDITDQVQEKES